MADSGGTGPVTGIPASRSLRQVKGTTRKPREPGSAVPDLAEPPDEEAEAEAEDQGHSQDDRKGRFIDERC